jgi:hypothetical protein
MLLIIRLRSLIGQVTAKEKVTKKGVRVREMSEAVTFLGL